MSNTEMNIMIALVEEIKRLANGVDRLNELIGDVEEVSVEDK